MGFDKKERRAVPTPVLPEKEKQQLVEYKKKVFDEIGKLKVQLSDLKSAIQKVKEEKKKVLSGFEVEVKLSQNNILTLNETVSKLKKEIEETRNRLAEMTTQVEIDKAKHRRALLEEKAKREEYAAEQKENIAAAETQLQLLQRQIAEDEVKLEAIRATHTALVFAISKKEEELSLLTSEIVEVKEDKIKKGKELKSLAKKIEAAGITLKECEIKISDFEAQIAKAKGELSKAQSSLAKIVEDREANMTRARELAQWEVDLKIEEKALANRKAEIVKRENKIKEAQQNIT